VVGDGGANAGQRTTRGGVVVRAGDFNPERIFLDDLFTVTPNVDVADRFPGAITGVIDYSFGNFKLQALALPPPQPAALPRETAVPAAPDELAVATFNVENLDAADPPARFSGLASLIVNGLKSPDILALEEVQDDNGPTNDPVVDATRTYALLIQAIKDAGGPAYEVRQINPRDDQDGGQPGGNIRVALLFRFDRGLCFVDRPGAGPDTATIPVLGPDGLQLTFSPGRIDPTNTAWSNSRKPLAGEFRYNGQALFVIANHFNSKGGDDPLFGRFQPPVLNTEAQRRQQAQVERDFISALLSLDPQARVVALGDLNDFEFSPPLAILKGTDVTALVETLPPGERYTYVFDGNSQALDHTLVSPSLLGQVVAYDVLHVNAEYVQRESDHDPQVTRFRLGGTPTPPGGASCGPAVAPPPTPTATATSAITATPTPSPTVAASPTATASATTAPPATATVSPTPLPAPTVVAGRVSVFGGGVVDAPDGTASFGLSVRQRPGAAVTGTFVYRSLRGGPAVRSDSITSLEVSGSEATFSGTCTDLTRNAPCTFSAVATEGERLGRGGSLRLQIDGAGAEGGPVRAGMVRISE
jgi:endonuclease/exonuclease/phosphatase family metal-dependent hydrolase